MTGPGTLLHICRACLGLSVARRHWRYGVLALLTLMASILEVVGVAAVLPFIGMVNDPDLVLRHWLLSQIHTFIGLESPRDFVILSGLCLLALVLSKNVLLYVQTWAQCRLLYGDSAQLSTHLFGLQMRMPYLRQLQTNSAVAMTTTNHAADQVFLAVMVGLVGVATEGLAMIGVLLVLLIAEPMMTSVAMLVMLAVAGPLYYSMRRHMERFGRMNMVYYESRLRILNQGFGSIKTLKVSGREAEIVDRYARVRADNAALLADNILRQQLPRGIMETLLVAGVVGTVVAALLQGRDTAAITAVLGLFAVAAFRLMPAINRVLAHLNNIRQGLPSVERVMADLRDLADLPQRLDSTAPLVFRNTLVLDDVRFSYPSADVPVLNGVSLTINRGEAVALVGASGAGKSTLADVILGLLPLQGGRVLSDGTDIFANLSAWQRYIGYVPQHIYIADESLRCNVAYAVPEAEIDDQRVRKALEMAQLTDVVATLPDGLDTVLGEHGTRLSGGQRQRVGLARALYNDPDVLILDEATSALDNETEFEVTRTIEGLRGHKTLIIIAHRLSTVRRCDRLIMLEAGTVVAEGGYDHLLATSPHFQNMVNYAVAGSAGQKIGEDHGT